MSIYNGDQKYPKYTWIEVDAERNTSDFRPESYRPNLATMAVEPKPNKVNWNERRKILFSNTQVYTNLTMLIDEAKSKSRTSLAIFKPKRILDFVIEADNGDWDPKKLASLLRQSKQLNLFQTVEEIENEFKVVQKIPYKFSYRFEDDSGRSSKMMIEDWEIGMLYLNCLRNADNDETVAIAKVKEKYLDAFLKKDLYFFLGTTKSRHLRSRNPFIIVGVFYPPIQSPEEQLSIFDL